MRVRATSRSSWSPPTTAPARRTAPRVLERGGVRLREGAPRHQDRCHRPLLEGRRPRGRRDGQGRQRPGHRPRSVRTRTTPRAGKLYTADETLAIRTTANFLRLAHRRGQGRRHAVRPALRRQHPAALLQPEAVRAGGLGRPRDLGRHQQRRRGPQGEGRRLPLRPAARPGGGPGRDPDVAAQRQRRLHGRRRLVRHRLGRERRHVPLAADNLVGKGLTGPVAPASWTGRRRSRRSPPARSACSTATPP